MSETVHATCVAIGGRAVLLAGRPGAGKSDLALRLIDRGARLVSDDYTIVRAEGDRLFASAPATIAGKIEVRGVGVVAVEPVGEARVCLYVDLDRAPERLPQPFSMPLVGLQVPALALAALETSAPLKLEAALDLFGLPAT